VNDAAARARAWVHSRETAVCDVIEPWEHGTIVRATRYPSYFDLNLVRAEDGAELSAAEVVAVADEALDGLSHRQFGFAVARAGERARPGLEELGWKTTRLVWMLHSGEPVSRPELAVERVPYDEVHDLRVAWLFEDFPTLDTSEYFDHEREISTARGVEVFAVRDDRGVPVAYAELELPGHGAEITSVYVHPDHRGAGIGTALTGAAIEAASTAGGDVWIVADADGRARRVYERLGFNAVWTLLNCMRLPPE
jgi:ribosomal protein S18 acetylase RimI-like enzyme